MDNSATTGSVNQVQMTYNTFSQLIEEQQEHGGAIGGSTPEVGYGYFASPTTTNRIWPSSITYANSRTLAYSYGTVGSFNQYTGYVASIIDESVSPAVTLTNYTYLGSGTVVQITYPQPTVQLDLWGGTSGTFTGFDSFNRIINQNWVNISMPGFALHIDQYAYGYDQNSNRTYKANYVSNAAGVYLDEAYTYVEPGIESGARAGEERRTARAE